MDSAILSNVLEKPLELECLFKIRLTLFETNIHSDIMKTLSLLITGLLACTGNIYDDNGQIREEVREFVEENNLNLGGENGPYWKNKRNFILLKENIFERNTCLAWFFARCVAWVCRSRAPPFCWLYRWVYCLCIRYSWVRLKKTVSFWFSDINWSLLTIHSKRKF